MIAAAFHPKDVILRLSDFKTNEYASLIGGRDFEVHEENPMLGFRGATRYVDESFRPCFELECRALRHVREAMGLTNVWVMVPFVRTLDEALEGGPLDELHHEDGLRLVGILFLRLSLLAARGVLHLEHRDLQVFEPGVQRSRLSQRLVIGAHSNDRVDAEQRVARVERFESEPRALGVRQRNGRP